MTDWEEVQTDMWIPEEPGDAIEGTYLGVQPDVGENKSKLYTIETEAKKQFNFWGSTVLDGKMIGVKPGQAIKVEFLGKVKPEGKKEYKSYKVYVSKVVASVPA